MKYLVPILLLLIFAGYSPAQTADELVARADAAVRAGKAEDGIREATAAIKLDPKKSTAYRVRAQAYLKLVEQEKRFEYVPELDKRFPASVNTDNALADAAKALELDPKDAYAMAVKGGVQYFLNDLAQSMAEFKRAAEASPAEPWFKNTYTTIRNRLSTQYALAGHSKSDAAKRLTDPAQKGKLRREALALHTKAIELNPTEDNFSSRIYVLEDLGEYEQAIADLNEAIRLQPDRHLNYWRRGQMFHKLKRYDDAVTSFRGGLAQVERLSGDTELPRNDFRADIAKNLALAGKFDEAFAMFELALSGKKPSYVIQYERGMAYLLKGDKEMAAADFRKTLDLMQGYLPALEELRKMGKIP